MLAEDISHPEKHPIVWKEVGCCVFIFISFYAYFDFFFYFFYDLLVIQMRVI